MNKFLTKLLAGTFALTLSASAFALDAFKAVDAVKSATTKASDKVMPTKAEPVKGEPAKVEAAKVEPTKAAEPAKVATTTVAKPTATMKKHHRKHAKKLTT